jgi:hypothetical protein
MTADDLSSRIAVPKVEATPDSHDLVHTRSKQLIVLLGLAGAVVLGVLAARGVELTVYPEQETRTEQSQCVGACSTVKAECWPLARTEVVSSFPPAT